jgi:hypothetical protein
MEDGVEPRGRGYRGVCFGWCHRRARGRSATVAPAFWREKLSMILRERVAGSGKWDMRAGTSEQRIERVTFWGERASVVVGTGVAFCGERASGVGWRRQRRAITTCVSDVRKKGDPGWQSKETSPKTRAYPIGSPTKETHPNKHASPVRNYQ